MKNRVRQLREKQGLTQKQLGERVNVSRQAINAVETGKFDPSLWLAYDIAQLFNKSIEEVFDLTLIQSLDNFSLVTIAKELNPNLWHANELLYHLKENYNADRNAYNSNNSQNNYGGRQKSKSFSSWDY